MDHKRDMPNNVIPSVQDRYKSQALRLNPVVPVYDPANLNLFTLPHVFARQYYTLLSTVDSRYLELRYLEFCETRSVYLNQNYIFIAFSNHNWRSRLMQYAIKFRNVRFVQMLCDAGADVNQQVRVNNYFWVSPRVVVTNTVESRYLEL